MRIVAYILADDAEKTKKTDKEFFLEIVSRNLFIMRLYFIFVQRKSLSKHLLIAIIPVYSATSSQSTSHGPRICHVRTYQFLVHTFNSARFEGLAGDT